MCGDLHISARGLQRVLRKSTILVLLGHVGEKIIVKFINYTLALIS
jgi:hypothetical protein